MKFEVKDLKVDIMMNSSSLNKGKNVSWNTKSTQNENQGFGIISGERNSIRQSSNSVKSQSGGNELTSS
ncbi:hypothetical protein FZC76_03110 [Sutcliffiella horikoshii]|uniref:Uncharacterized protein n=1 Tax=Sutcliffiella horikoshii TaxID=79883 RepID=A0A5D4T8S6_9BACI|nr:hypothetical protein [Sutcliffiella horikoshii]TYS70902.1 hypothetical protein FZC76_03110 [Sutcliffiella horikoshii]